MPEGAFWSMELSALLSVAGNKLAYDSYLAAEQERVMRERR